MGVAANNFRRFREPKLQDTIKHRYLWLKFQIFSLVNNWDLKEQNENLKKLDFSGGFFAVLETCYVEKFETLKQHMNFDMAKKVWPQYQFVMSKRRIPLVFFIKFIFLKHFIGISPPKMYLFLMCQFKCISGKNILCIFTFVKTLNHSPAQNLSNKKTGAFCVFCGQIYCFDSLPSFDTHALYFVRPLYTN
jgi:hypothetical protein